MFGDLQERAHQQGLADAIHPVIFSYSFAITETIKALLERDAIVVLDEFQYARELGIVNGVKRIIDEIKITPEIKTSGNLVVAGSHQQKILEMLYSTDEPLYGRFNNSAPISLIDSRSY